MKADHEATPQLRARLQALAGVVAPGAVDALSGRIVERGSRIYALLVAFTLASTSVALSCVHAQSQNPDAAAGYPNRPARIVVPFSPGGGTDIVARTVAQKLTEAWGQSFLVENRPGANGIVGTDAVAKSKPEATTILVAIATHVINPSVYSKLPYDTNKDFVPLTVLAEYPFTLVIHPSLPASSVKELITLAKARPGQLTYATSGIASGPHLGLELFSSMAGIKMVHVPYKGSGPGMVDLMAGQVQLSFNNLLSSLPW